MLSTTPASGVIDGAQWSWNDDSSAHRTSTLGCVCIASSTGNPMLPHAAASRPPSITMSVNIDVVVVFPLVPVTTSQVRGAPNSPARSTRHASSTSPHTGISCSAAATIKGLVGENPGDAMTRSVAAGQESSARRSAIEVRRAPAVRAASVPTTLVVSAPPNLASAIVTSASTPRRNRAADIPAVPAPATSTRLPLRCSSDGEVIALSR